jgi:hypothetical protein
VLRITAAALFATGASVAIAAGSRLAALSVAVQVKPSATFKLHLNNAQLDISNADVARGYIELPAGSRLSMSTGRIRPTVLFDFSPGMGPFKSVEITSEDLGYATEGTWQPRAVTVAALSFRFNLIGKAAPGPHQLPLILNIDF